MTVAYEYAEGYQLRYGNHRYMMLIPPQKFAYGGSNPFGCLSKIENTIDTNIIILYNFRRYPYVLLKTFWYF